MLAIEHSRAPHDYGILGRDQGVCLEKEGWEITGLKENGVWGKEGVFGRRGDLGERGEVWERSEEGTRRRDETRRYLPGKPTSVC